MAAPAIWIPVKSFNSRTGAITLVSGDVTGALGYTPANKAGDTFTGLVTVPTLKITTGAQTGYILTATDNLGNATWAAAPSGGVTTFNTRSGAVTLTSADVTGALTYTPVNKAGDSLTGNLIYTTTGKGPCFGDATSGLWFNGSNTLFLHNNSGALGFSNYSETQSNLIIFGNGTIESKLITAAGSGGLQKYTISLEDGNHGISLTKSSGTIIDNALVLQAYADDFQLHSANKAFPLSSASLSMRVKSGQLQLFKGSSVVNDSTQDVISIMPTSVTAFWRGIAQYQPSATVPTLSTDYYGAINWRQNSGDNTGLQVFDKTTGALKSYLYFDGSGNISFGGSAGTSVYFNPKFQCVSDFSVIGNANFEGQISFGTNAPATAINPTTQIVDTRYAWGYNGGSPINDRFQQLTAKVGASTTGPGGYYNYWGWATIGMGMSLSGYGLSVGQNGVGVPSAILQCVSTTQGFLPPQMTTTQRNAVSSPADGLIVHDTTLHRPHFYNGSAWYGLIGVDANNVMNFPAARVDKVVTLTPSGGAVSVDARLANTFLISTAANLTINNPTNSASGEAIFFEVTNTGGASITVSMDTNYTFGDDVTSIPAVAAGKTLLIGCKYSATLSKWCVASATGGFS